MLNCMVVFAKFGSFLYFIHLKVLIIISLKALQIMASFDPVAIS